MCLSHPHEVHVAGQQVKVRSVLGLVTTTEVTIGQQNVNYQLQVGFPSDRLAEQNHSCLWNSKIRTAFIKIARISKLSKQMLVSVPCQ